MKIENLPQNQAADQEPFNAEKYKATIEELISGPNGVEYVMGELSALLSLGEGRNISRFLDEIKDKNPELFLELGKKFLTENY